MHKIWFKCVVGVGLMLLLQGCGDECLKYSAYTCRQLAQADYNVYFYYPSGLEKYLGETSGLGSCGNIAHSFAEQEEVPRADWTYICCLKTSSSDCAEKHR